MATVIRAKQFFGDMANGYGAALVRTLNNCDAEKLRALVEKVYLPRSGLRDLDTGRVIDFVHQPLHWGNERLKDNTRAVIFLRSIRGEFCERAWRGHFVVKIIHGEEFSILPHAKMELVDDFGEAIEKYIGNEFDRSTLIPLRVVGEYLRDLRAVG